MTTKIPEKKSLRGIGSLSKTFSAKPEKNEETLIQEVALVSIDKIKEDPHNVRRKYNESSLKDFADVLKVVGISSPLVVRNNPDADDGIEYIIYNGHRRFRAAKIAGLTEVPITVNNKFNVLLQLSDNLVSEDLDLLDTAEAIHTIITSQDPEVKRTREDVAKGISKSPTWISKILKIRSMPHSIQLYYDLGRITDLDAIYQLTINYSKFSSEIIKWLEQYKESSDLISQGAVKTFINGLKKAETPKKKSSQKTDSSKETSIISQEESSEEILETGIAPQCFDITLTSNNNRNSVDFESTDSSQDQSTDFSINDEDEKGRDDNHTPLYTNPSENLPLPVIAESDLENGINPNTPLDDTDTKLTFSFEVKGSSFIESVSISKEIEKFIEENFSSKVILKSTK